MKKTLKKKNKNIAAEVGVGAVAAAALAMAGGYILWERMGKEKRAKVKAWAQKARKEAVQNLARAKHVSEVEYKRIVDHAVQHYGSLSNVNKAELIKAAQDLKSEWKRIQSQAKVMAKQMQKAQKPLKKASVGKSKVRKPRAAKR